MNSTALSRQVFRFEIAFSIGEKDLRLLLPNHFARIFVLTQSQKYRLAQLSITRPLGKLDLANKLRVYPAVSPHFARRDSLHPFAVLFRGQISKRTSASFIRTHLFVQSAEQFGIETGADLAGKKQSPLIVITNQQRAEMLARACRRSVATDDEFLLVHAFQFDPNPATAAGFVNGIALLTDETFQTAPLNFRQQRFCFSPERSREANDVARRRDQPRQQFFPQSKRQTYQTAAIQLQEIEYVKCERRVLAIKL